MPLIDAQALNKTSAFMFVVQREQTGESRMPDMPAPDAFPFASQVFLIRVPVISIKIQTIFVEQTFLNFAFELRML